MRGLRVLGEGPFRPRPKAGILALSDADPRKYRLRIGEYRVIDSVLTDEVKVIDVFVRGRGYR